MEKKGLKFLISGFVNAGPYVVALRQVKLSELLTNIWMNMNEVQPSFQQKVQQLPSQYLISMNLVTNQTF